MSFNAKFFELAKKYENMKKEMDAVRADLQAVMLDLGVGSYLQDIDDSTVYKIVKPTGTFVYYKDIDYVRTAKDGERAGTLSKKEAEEKGFTLPKKS
jgi:hypothetical protein